MRQSAPKSNHAELIRQADRAPLNYSNALESLVLLQDAPNQSIRGQTTLEAQSRIRKFLESDPIFKAICASYAEGQSDAKQASEDFRKGTEDSLKILERLAHRNSDLPIPTHLESKHKFAYRLVAIQLYSELTGIISADRKNSSVLRLGYFERVELHQSAQPNVQEQGSDTSQPPKEQLLGPEIGPDDEASFSAIVKFYEGQMPSIREQLELSNLVAKLRANGISRFMSEVLNTFEAGNSDLTKQRDEVASCAQACLDLKTGDNCSIHMAQRLYARITHLPQSWCLSGLNSTSGALDLLVQEKLLTPDARAVLEAANQTLVKAPKLAVELLNRVEPAEAVKTQHLIDLIEIIQRFSEQDKDARYFQGRIGAVIAIGPDRIGHVLNCARLGSRQVHVDDLISLSPQAMAVINRAAQGEFDDVPLTDSHYARRVRARIDLELTLIRTIPPELRADIDSAEATLGPSSGNHQIEISRCLMLAAPHLGSNDRKVQLVSLGLAVKELSKSDVSFPKLLEMLDRPPHDVSVMDLAKFIKNLASLHQSHARGLKAVVENAHQLWKKQTKGDATQNMRGPLIEAQVAVKLIEKGYRNIVMSEDSASGYDYDITGISDTGEKCAIEVKRGLATVVGKNGGVWEHDHKSQLERFVQSCLADGNNPYFAIVDFHDAAWAEAPLSDLRDHMHSQFGLSPGVINGNTGKVIQPVTNKKI